MANQPVDPVDPLGVTGFAEPAAVDSFGATDIHAAIVIDPRGDTDVHVVAGATHVGPAPAPPRPQPPAVAIAPTAPPKPATVPPKKSRAWIALLGVALVGGGSAVAVVAFDRTDAHAPAPAPARGSDLVVKPPPPPAPFPPVEAPPQPSGPTARTPEELADLEQTALANDDMPTLTALLAPEAFAFGPGASPIATTRDEAAALIERATNPTMAKQLRVNSSKRRVGRDGDAAWIAETIDLAAPDATKAVPFVTTQLAVADAHGAWHTVAWHWAIALPDDVAYAAAVKHALPELAPIAEAHAGADDLAAAVRTALASRKALAAALSARDDATTIGSAPHDLLAGGARSRAWFAKMRAELVLAGGLRCARAGATTGWCAANASFTATTPRGRVTETFRTLLVLVREGDAWRVVQAQFSNGQ